jgi:hypothetical protein
VNAIYAATTLDSLTLRDDRAVWLADCNCRRVRGSLGKTPVQRLSEKTEAVPLWDEIVAISYHNTEADHVDQLRLNQRLEQAPKKWNDVRSTSHA